MAAPSPKPRDEFRGVNALREALPTRRHGEMLFEIVSQALGDAAWLESAEGTLYVRVHHETDELFTHHNRSNSDRAWETTECFPVSVGAGNVGLTTTDFHGTKMRYQPDASRGGEGVCKFESKRTLTMSLIVLPGGDGVPFGLPKVDRATGGPHSQSAR